MKSLILFLLLLSTSVLAQNTTRTILALPNDSSKVDLHLTEIKRLNTTAHLLFAAGVISTIVVYNLDSKSPMLFAVPLSFCLSGMGVHMYQTRLEAKYQKD